MSWMIDLAVAFAALLGMEGVAWAAHKYVMHGWGWGWHRSHHEPRRGAFERNDLYAVVFAAISIALIAAGTYGDVSVLAAVGAGMTGYGLIYVLFHDALVHQRFKLGWMPHAGYLKRLVQAHRLHHAVHDKHGCVSFGFLYAPPVETLLPRLKTAEAPRATTP